MAITKRTVAFSFLLAFSGALLADSRTPSTLLEDLVRMTRAGSSDVTVLAYAKAHRFELPAEVSDSDLRWLRDLGVSQVVVRYMAAIDVRAPIGNVDVDTASGSYDVDDAAHPLVGYTYPESRDSYTGSYADSDPGYADNSAGYAGSYDLSYGYGYGYPYGYSAYPVYYFVDRHGFSHRFHDRDHRWDLHHGPGGGHGSPRHHGDVVGQGASRDAWRERGFSERRGSPGAVGPRGSGRQASVNGSFGSGFQGNRGRVVGSRGLGPSGAAPGSHPHVFRGAPGNAGGHGGFGHPRFSGGPHASGGFSHSSGGATGSSRGRRR